MMQPQGRMSPLTAFFLGLFGVGAIGISAAAIILLFGMSVIDTHVGGIWRFAESATASLPAILDGLPPALKDAMHDRRAPEYAKSLEANVQLIEGTQECAAAAAVTIHNQGSELVSLLTIRVAGFDAQGRAVKEWTTLAATPIGIADEWRGPLMPGGTRHIVLDSGCFREWAGRDPSSLAVEIADVRVWTPSIPVEVHARAAVR